MNPKAQKPKPSQPTVREYVEEPAVKAEPSPVYALWAVPFNNLMLVRSDEKLWLIDAALWTGERKFSVPADRLQPAPSWVELTRKVTPELVSELMLISGIIDAETLASPEHIRRFYQNLMATYATSLREQT